MPGCPHQQLAEERLRQALDDAGLAPTTRVIDGQADTERPGFTGSPPSLVCRIYGTPPGRPGQPESGHLRQALEAAAAQ
ncbi:hypothetical protein ABZ896_28005 [Streptomyces sp. NPDC047072]|uniref:hypothetical protein n=1 Tax=Streptomyces sp. NPDC047072 TaxID=3154809 RepID=UPI0033CAF34E